MQIAGLPKEELHCERAFSWTQSKVIDAFSERDPQLNPVVRGVHQVLLRPKIAFGGLH
jgi:hypothetical protein